MKVEMSQVDITTTVGILIMHCDDIRPMFKTNNLLQLVDFNAWSRTINGVKKESLLDHIYSNNCESVDSVYYKTPVIGDHQLVILKLSSLTLQSMNNSHINVCQWYY